VSLNEKTDINLIDEFIPSNPFLSLSDGIIPATVLFCLFLGFALMFDDGSGPIVSILKILLRALGRMTHIISLTFPVGVFVITADMAGTLTVEGFLELQVFLVSLAAAALLLELVVLPLLFTCFTPFSYRAILAFSSRAMILAFSTGTEFISLPLISEGVEKLFSGQVRDPEGRGRSAQGGGRNFPERCYAFLQRDPCSGRVYLPASRRARSFPLYPLHCLALQ
jgi:Na+/H+-dicarboxylate symporter